MGTSESPELKLIEPESLPLGERKTFEYVALSYPWGDPVKHPHADFETTTKNVQSYMNKIEAKLPDTLNDAIRVCRAIGKRYLWIDSLCIIQGPDGDFTQEAGRMGTVFSSAYCVLATTSADGSHSGFLNRTSRREIGQPPEYEVVSFPYMGKDGNQIDTIYIEESFDNFQADVREGRLNQRGWVYQERALARRTIHFTNNQTYWECGRGIRCETLTKMKNSYESFPGDANFPWYGLHHQKGGDIAFYESLYEQYSLLSFTHLEDRPVAIAGLEQRLISALQQKGGAKHGCYGIFGQYWGRGLLWQRAYGAGLHIINVIVISL